MEILYEDGICLAVLKPAGLPTQAPERFDSLESRIRKLLDGRAASAELVDKNYLAILHRLDRAVSGVVLFAKTRRAARVISRQFERRQIRKTYWACVEGTVAPSSGTWVDFMCKVPDQPRSEIISPEHTAGQQAVLHYRLLEERPCGSWLEIELETGRMHQIRLQAAARGHAVLGDVLYGSQTAFGPAPAEERDRQIALHARAITFAQPDTREEITVVAPLPGIWSELGLPTAH